ncbi:MAG: hypothetical protein AAGG51_07035 [Cyanobacteria bacterium P01_G01_bin.54]
MPMHPGDKFGMVIVPKSTIAQALEIGDTAFFSIETANAFDNIHFVRWDLPWDDGIEIISIEDSPVGDVPGDFLDIVIVIDGVDDVTLTDIKDINDRPNTLLQAALSEAIADLTHESEQTDSSDSIPKSTPESTTTVEATAPLENVTIDLPEPPEPILELVSAPKLDLGDSFKSIEPSPALDPDAKPITSEAVEIAVTVSQTQSPNELLTDPSTAQALTSSEHNHGQSPLVGAMGSKLILEVQSSTNDDPAQHHIPSASSQTLHNKTLQGFESAIPEPRFPNLKRVELEQLLKPNLLLPLMRQGLVIFAVAETDLVMLIQDGMVLLVQCKTILFVDVDGTINCLVQLQEDIVALVSETAIWLADLEEETSLIIHWGVDSLIKFSGNTITLIDDWLTFVEDKSISILKTSSQALFFISALMVSEIEARFHKIFRPSDEDPPELP